MTETRNFQINSNPTALQPSLQAALDDIVAAVRDGKSIGGDSADQWVFCRTSGSTGAPKVIRRSPESWIASFEVNRSLFGFSAMDRVATLGALDHSLTLYAVLEALHLGMAVQCLHGVSPSKQASELANASVLYATPAQMRLLLSVKQSSFPKLRLVLTGGGKLDAECRNDLQRAAPNADIREFFGASETSFVTITDALSPEGSVGRAYPGVTLRLEEGELWVKSPYLFDGYEGAGGEAHWHDGFLSFGEMAELDDDGHLTLLGRKDRMVTIADQNVYPEAIEAALLNQTGIRHAAVLAQPDGMRGSRLMAVVEGKVSAELGEALRGRFGSLVTPREIYEIAKMPLLPAGKPDLQAVVRWLEDQ